MMASCKDADTDKALTTADPAARIEALEQQLEQQKVEHAKQSAIDSMQMIAELKMPMAIPAAPTPVKTKIVYVKERKQPESTPAPVVTEPAIADVPSTVPVLPVPEEKPAKKGWSNTAKGAVIGAGVGAIGGAVINKKNRVKGAVIGGVIGAVAGTGTGIILDKRKKQNEFQY